jgi:hypothetical protein
MTGGIDFGINLENLSVLANYIGNALGVFIPGRFARPISQSNFPVRVAQQGKGKLKFLRKGSVILDGVKTDAKDLYVFRVVLSDSITESFAFVGSAGCVCLRVKPQDHLISCKFAQRNLFPLMGLYLEFGSLFSG